MTHVVLYFQVHQPWRLSRYGFFDVGGDAAWFDEALNARILRKVARRCYVPATRLLLRLVERGTLRCAFSVSGTALGQLERFAPEALEGFQALARTGAVEMLGETSHHSLAFLADPVEFREQVAAQAARTEALFGRRPTTFRNTELVVASEVARVAAEQGFDALLGEGADHLLGFRDPTRLYRPTSAPRLRLLLRHYGLSDDVAFRFVDRHRAGDPLTPEAFARRLEQAGGDGADGREAVVGLFMDFETLGEHQDESTGILRFLEGLPAAVARGGRARFSTPRDVVERGLSSRPLRLPRPVSWADAERDLTAWLGNAMQREAHRALYDLLPHVRGTGDAALLEAWRRLSTSDHVYYMCTKFFADGDVHKYFSPYGSPHDAYVTFCHVLDDLAARAGAPAPAPGRPSEAR